MAFDQIEELKEKYTDKYVVVDRERPELARFRDTYGTVKTVNMSGRALVEFADYHLNIGWYDIDPMFLTVVDTPPAPKPKPVAEAKTPPPKAPASAAAAPKAKPAAKPAAGGKPSTADILAQLRAGGGAAAQPAAKAEASEAKSTPAKPAAPKAEGAVPAKVDRSKMSVADMLAAARSGGAKGAAASAEAKPQAEEAPAAEEDAGEEQAAAEAVESAPSPAKPTSGEKVDKSTMTIDQMIAWCRQHDS